MWVIRVRAAVLLYRVSAMFIRIARMSLKRFWWEYSSEGREATQGRGPRQKVEWGCRVSSELRRERKGKVGEVTGPTVGYGGPHWQ